MKLIVHFFLLFLFTLVINTVHSQEKKEKKEVNYSKSILFNNLAPLNIELKVNKKSLLKDVKENPHYHQVVVKYQDSVEGLKECNFEISTRGNFRKNPQNCNSPPLKLSIPDEISKSSSLFCGQNKIKLVLPCLQESEKSQECLILEYLVYKTYELFTNVSYRTRLVNIAMIDSAKENHAQNFTGFFLEETEQLAKRNNGKVLKLKRFHPEKVDRSQMTFLAVFQYFISNTDWSVQAMHNIKLIFIQDQTIPLAIPYDFDWSGIVNASYAIPAPQLEIKSVRERLFRGYERSMEEYEPVIKLFNDKKQEIFNLYKNCEWLSERTKESTIKYIDEFYEIINSPKLVEREFIKNCRKL